MKDRQKIFLDKVVKLLVDDTEINYKNEKITTPFFFSLFQSFPSPLLPLFSSFPPFTSYCKNVYGLTDQEIEYVWEEYKNIIKDKIKNNER